MMCKVLSLSVITSGTLWRRWQHDWIKYDSLDWAGTVLPCLTWLRHYRWRKDLQVCSSITGVLSSLIAAFVEQIDTVAII
jgi:hypothetical protein